MLAGLPLSPRALHPADLESEIVPLPLDSDCARRLGCVVIQGRCLLLACRSYSKQRSAIEREYGQVRQCKASELLA